MHLLKKTALILLIINAYSCANYKIQSYSESDILLTDSIASNDDSLDKLISPYKTNLEQSMSEVLNQSSIAMPKPDRKIGTLQPEFLLGNFVADLCLVMGKQKYSPKDNQTIDLCALNTGGLRTSIPQGDISRGKIFELMPFENELVVLTLSGKSTQKLLHYIASQNGIPVSGLRMSIKNNQPNDVLINNSPFDSTQTYKIITSDYLARGGDKMTFFSEHLKSETIGLKLRDAIIQYVIQEKKAGRNLTSTLDQRVKLDE